MKKHPRLGLFVGAVTCFAAGILCSWLVFMSTQTTATASKSLRLTQSDYPHVSPLLLCNINQPQQINEDKGLESQVRTFISDHIAQNKVDNMSVYIIDYRNGKWAGVNQGDQYDPASMLKVPVMMAYYREAEKDPSILTQQIAFNGDDQNTDEYFKSPNNIVSGKYYTVEQLIESMIINSDNTALVLLTQHMNPADLVEVYSDLNLPLPGTGTPDVQYLSAESYAYFFRVLYNGTYLTREYSEKALTLLMNTDIPGIRAGVPEGTDVAQKFGERTTYDKNNVVNDRELHDCGIVYKADNPYLLCIMSRGKKNDFPTLAKNISDLSALVYKNI